METESIVSCIIIRSSDMIKQVVRHCQDWVFNYSQLLLGETVDLIEGFYEYIEMNGERWVLNKTLLYNVSQIKSYEIPA